MRLEIFDQPWIFLIVLTILVFGIAHLAHAGANALNWNGIANYFSAPTVGANGGN